MKNNFIPAIEFSLGITHQSFSCKRLIISLLTLPAFYLANTFFSLSTSLEISTRSEEKRSCKHRYGKVTDNRIFQLITRSCDIASSKTSSSKLNERKFKDNLEGTENMSYFVPS